MDHYSILDVGVSADHDGFHIARGVDLVSADHGVGTNEYVFVNDDFAAENGGLIDIGAFMDLRQMAAGIFANHESVIDRLRKKGSLIWVNRVIHPGVWDALSSVSAC